MLTLALVLGILAGPSAADDTTDPDDTTTTALEPSSPSVDITALSAEAARVGDVRVIVRVEDGSDPTTVVDHALAGTDHDIGAASDDIVGVEVDSEGLERLASTPGVESIVDDIVMGVVSTPAEMQVVGPIRADAVHDRGVTGTGRRVAVLDSGADLTHPAFAGVSSQEGCFVAMGPEACGATTGAGSAMPCSPSYPGCDHGTHIAGLLVGQGTNGLPRGVAPGAELIALRVLSPWDNPGDNPDQGVQVVARLSKGVIPIPCNGTIDAIGIANLLIAHVYKRFGLYNSIISDRGPQFASQVSKEFCRLMDIKQRLSTAYHPQTDGETERVNQELKTYLRIFTSNNIDQCASHLHLAEFAHNV
jgi:subtilisin family serine protease